MNMIKMKNRDEYDENRFRSKNRDEYDETRSESYDHELNVSWSKNDFTEFLSKTHDSEIPYIIG